MHAQAGVIGLLAAVFAASVITITYRGSAASGYAIGAVGMLAMLLLSLLTYTRPLITLTAGLVFMTSPMSLVLSLQWSAFISAFLLSGAFLGFLLRTPRGAITSDPLLVPIALFTSYAILSAAYGVILRNDIGYLLGDVFQIIEFATVYFLVSQLLNHRNKIYLLLKVLLASMLITILVELFLSALGPAAGDLLPSWDGSFISGELIRTIDIDATILFAVLINLYPVAASRRQRWWICVALVPTVANIVFSLSRGLWLCALVSIIVSAVLLARKARKRVLVGFAVAGVAVTMIAAGWRINSGSESDSDISLLSVLEERVFYGADQIAAGLAGTESMATRRFLEVAIVGPQVFAQPWIGHGLGATYVIGGYAVLDSGTEKLIDHHFIHNLYLVTAFRMGIIGLSLLLGVVFLYFRRILRGTRIMPVGISRALVTGFVAIIVGQLFLSITQPTIIDHPTGALIACAMAMSFRLQALEGTE